MDERLGCNIDNITEETMELGLYNVYCCVYQALLLMLVADSPAKVRYGGLLIIMYGYCSNDDFLALTLI